MPKISLTQLLTWVALIAFIVNQVQLIRLMNREMPHVTVRGCDFEGVALPVESSGRVSVEIVENTFR